MSEIRLPEPWLRGTVADVSSVQRALLHALELAEEDLEKWCGSMTDEQVNARPCDLAPVAFHIRHIARSLDRLMSYAEGKDLTAEQLAVLNSELDPGATRVELFEEFKIALVNGARRIRSFEASSFENARSVGKKQLPTTVGGLLVHVADHTQRHVGQAITTAKVVLSKQA